MIRWKFNSDVRCWVEGDRERARGASKGLRYTFFIPSAGDREEE